MKGPTWARPALLVALAAPLLVLGVLAADEARTQARAGSLLADDGVCASAAEEDCLTPVTTDFGLQARTLRQARHRWVVESGGEQIGFEAFAAESEALRASEGEVTALLYDDDVAAIELADGTRVEALGVGSRGAAERAVWAWALLGGAVLLVAHAAGRAWAGIAAVPGVIAVLVAWFVSNTGAPWPATAAMLGVSVPIAVALVVWVRRREARWITLERGVVRSWE